MTVRLRSCALALSCAWHLVVGVGPAAAQTGRPIDSPTAISSGVTFLPRSSFHLTAERLSGDDERFAWDTNFGGDLDLVDYGYGRFNFSANYQAMLGEQFRPFDPNQGNYALAGELTGRTRGLEVGAVFYHQSRHLSDRAKRLPVDWNMVGASLSSSQRVGRFDLRTRGDVRRVVQRSFVDYQWEVVVESRARYDMTGQVAMLASGGLRRLGTDGTRNRGTQTGVRGEGGVRLSGRGGAVELFVAIERRIDPYPLEFGSARWATAGFRLLSR